MTASTSAKARTTDLASRHALNICDREQHDISQTRKSWSSDSHTDEAVSQVTGFGLILLMTSVSLACFLVLLDVSIIATAIPRITTQFSSINDIGWYGSVYTLASSGFQPLTGRLYSYFKIKWIFIIFFVIFELGSLLCGLAINSRMLIIGRTVAGLGSSAIMNGGLIMIAIGVPLERRPLLLSICTGLTQLGLVGGPLIGGALTEYASWRWCFYINLPIGTVATIVLLFCQVPDGRINAEQSLRKLPKRLDLVGFILFAPAASMVLMALNWGGDRYPWKSAPIIGLCCGGGVCAFIFAVWEKRAGDDAMMPASVMSKKHVWTACLITIFLFCTVMTSSFYLSLYFQVVKDASPFSAGVSMLPGILSQLVFAVVGGFLVQRIGYLIPFAVVGGAILAIANGLITTWSADTPTATWAGYQVLLGLGRGLSTQIPILAAQVNAEPSMIAAATSLLVFAQNFSGAVIIAIANAIFQGILKHELQARVPWPLAEAVMRAGASGVRQVNTEGYLPLILDSYLRAITAVFFLGVAGGCLMTIASFGMGWIDVREK